MKNYMKYVINDNKNSSASFMLWVFPFLAPVLTIIFSFLLQNWGWGLMDDLTILNAGNGILERFWERSYQIMSFGEFTPTSALHSAIFYSIFEHCPDKFYIFKALEICLIVLLWGFLAFRITKNILSIILVPVITLSFHYFYDGFFYLSSQEPTGLIFLGLALYFFLKNLEPFLIDEWRLKDISVKFKWGVWFIGLIFLFCAYGTKEPFISGGLALGLSYLYLGFKYHRTRFFRSFMLAGAFIVLITLAYGFFLLCEVRGVYSSNYIMSIPRMVSNLNLWFKKDFFNHIPWILLAVSLCYINKADFKRSVLSGPLGIKWGALLGVLFYVLYLLILLPWNAIGYYAGPLGLFFAFFITILISGFLSRINLRLQTAIVVCFLVFNQFVCQYALNREASYNYDKANLEKWLTNNNVYDFASPDNIIKCNAMEATCAIPRLIKWNSGVGINNFVYSRDPGGTVDGKKCNIYLYSPRFGGVDLSKLKDWDVIFFSKNWIMYRKKDRDRRT